MNIGHIVLYAAAGFAGWWVVACCDKIPAPREIPVTHVAPPSAGDAAAASLHAIQRPGGGSTELSRIATLMASIQEAGLADAQIRIETWPPGTPREFALAMLAARKPERLASDPSGPPGDASEPQFNLIREFAESMAAGETVNISYDDERWGDHTLSSWVSTDPATATAAILELPLDSDRSRAVDVAAQSLAKYDPAAAMEFVLKSGEQQLSTGASEAWAKSAIQNPAPENSRQYLDRMTPEQQNSLFTALALTVPDLNWNPTYSIYDDTNFNARDPLHRSDIGVIACSVLLAEEACPGIESLVHNLTNFPQAEEEVRRFLESCTSLSPAQQAAQEILEAEQMKNAAASGTDVSLFLSGDSLDGMSAAALDRAAPDLLAQLARAGRLSEAVQLLDRISDPDARRISVEAILPYWMATDSSAASAAFDAAPLTALERERWQRHPAFLPHP